MKKWTLLLTAIVLAFAFSTSATVEAKPKSGGSYSSPKKSFDSNTTQNKDSGVTKTEPTKQGTTGSTTPAATKPGFFSGGLMKGLLIGGLAGMLFGGLFGDMGFLGNILGLLINVAAIVIVIMLIRKIVVYFMDKRKRTKERYQP
ncbi:hypothetical protein [Paenibacillus sp. y28]|uniref:hypothetical protein n=1 Tax=Paenibacillus sp. y28 TaxID=3129110 RepID=UPI003019636A